MEELRNMGYCFMVDNDEGSYNYCRQLAQEARKEAEECSQVSHGIWTQKEGEKVLLADSLKETVELMLENKDA